MTQLFRGVLGLLVITFLGLASQAQAVTIRWELEDVQWTGVTIQGTGAQSGASVAGYFDVNSTTGNITGFDLTGTGFSSSPFTLTPYASHEHHWPSRSLRRIVET
jgi:hypothetical protein